MTNIARIVDWCITSMLKLMMITIVWMIPTMVIPLATGNKQYFAITFAPAIAAAGCMIVALVLMTYAACRYGFDIFD